MQAALLSEVVEAWMTSIDCQQGIFDRSFDQQAFKQAASTGESDALADNSLSQAVSEVDGLKAQHHWLIFLLEAWQVLHHCTIFFN